ncbi:methionine--tRNA ligase subunit beta [bacterium]|nr:methionine--tRNA ligase subunit beta [bacterium]
MIKFEDFQKLDLRIAKIIEAQKIKESEKLIILKIDIGGETRQIVAGIGKAYQAEELVGKKIVVLVNLEPKKLMGYESQGMLLAAIGKGGDPVLLVPEKDIEPGAKVS